MKNLFFIIIISTQIYTSDLVDMVIYSYDRPMQLYALLESIKEHVTDGIGVLSVIYRVSNNQYGMAYEKVKEDFPNVIFYKQGDKPQLDFKPLTMNAAFKGSNKYISFIVDDIIVKDKTSLSECISALEKTNAYCFLLRLGSNTTFCYTMKIQTPIPKSFKKISGFQDVYSWTFKDGLGDWNFPSNLDMSIYRKSDVENVLNAIEQVHFTNTFYEPYWCTTTSRDLSGLCFSSSKIVNLCINIVLIEQPSHAQFSVEWKEKNLDKFSTKKLLDIFLNNYKIDTHQLFKIQNISAHIEYKPTFTKIK